MLLDDDRLITRRHAAELLGRSLSWVRKLEASGALHPVQAADGRWLHRRDEVLALAAARDGQPGFGSGAVPGAARTRYGLHVQGCGEEEPLEVQPSSDDHTGWRQQRIDTTFVNVQHGLVTAGWPPLAIERALVAAVHALAGLGAAELHGPAWPAYVATSAAAAVLGTSIAVPWLHAQVVDEVGRLQLVPVRPVQPGD